MNRMLSIAAALVLIAGNALAQPFLVSTSPRSQTATGASVTYAVQVLANVTFKSTVYLSASAPTLSAAHISISPSSINSPYTDTAWVTLTLTGPKTGGTHNIIITGVNGPASASDTVQVTIPNRSAWAVYAASVVGPGNDMVRNPSQFMLDRKNGTGWFLGSDSLRSFDGTTWHVYAVPKSTRNAYKGQPRGMTIDSSGVLWCVYENGIYKRSGSTWTIMDTADATSGFSNDMLDALYGNYSEKYSCICTAPDGTVWLTGMNMVPSTQTTRQRVLWLMKYSSGAWTAYNMDNSQCPSVKGQLEFLVDNNNNVWIGASGSGVTMYDGTYWTNYSNLDIGLSKFPIPIASDRNGWTWFSQYLGDATLQFNGDSVTYFSEGRSSHPASNTVDSSYIGQQPHGLDIDKDGDMWLGLTQYQGEMTGIRYEGGLARHTGSNWYHYTIGNSGIPKNNTIQIGVDHNKMVWIITDDGGLTLLDGTAPPSAAFNGGGLSVGDDATTGSAQTGLSIMPNPASSSSTLRLHVAQSGHVRVRLVNSIGLEVATLLDETRQAGDLNVAIPVGTLSAGTYFIEYTSGGAVETKPFVVVR